MNNFNKPLITRNTQVDSDLYTITPKVQKKAFHKPSTQTLMVVKYCKKCFLELPLGSQVCDNCGTDNSDPSGCYVDVKVNDINPDLKKQKRKKLGEIDKEIGSLYAKRKATTELKVYEYLTNKIKSLQSERNNLANTL